jgi:Beta/Gamma crystallin
MSGRAFEIDRNVVRNLDGTGFNDRAASLSVLGGYWVFCSDANFEGDCRTFGPGDYPNLPFDLDRKISSGRRIADRYPYEGRPTWSR